MLGGNSQRRALVAMLALVVPAPGACGSSRQKNADGGDGSLAPPDGLAAGRHSFDVVAVLRADGSTSLPPTNRFTLVIDVDARVAIGGGNGRGGVVPFTTGDGRTFVTTGPIAVGDASSDSCGAQNQFHYEHVEVTIAGDGSLTGRATGTADISCGDCLFTVPFAATLSGTPDKTLPTLRASGIIPTNPFDAFGLATSEPLPATATARLVAGDGAAIDLIPTPFSGDVPAIGGFLKPDVVLRAGQGYVVALDGLVDFAGLSDSTGPPLRLVSFPAAPKIPEDGFESATESTLGGAMVVVMTAGALPVIAGNASLYIGGPGAPGLDTSNGRSLMIRLAREPGDTKLRFSCRAVAPEAQTPFWGVVRVGSEGAASMSPTYKDLGDATGATEKVLLDSGSVFLTPTTLVEVALADGEDDVLVSIMSSATGNTCVAGRGAGTGLLIDDLRLE